ncbi:MAG: hypothetical protein E7399_00620, partial [Ruminococcaceae bacterium]|nr:hypothetical protein [Oscillospiraceae bacterium]
MKKIICLILCMGMLFSMLTATVSAQEFTEGIYTYTVKNGEAIFTGYSGSDNTYLVIDETTIPSRLGGYPVTTIDNYAFSFIYITEITIPDSVTTINDNAFAHCSELEKIIIPNSVTSIGDNVFAGCLSLTEIIVDPNNPTYCSIDGNLFTKDKTFILKYANGKPASSYTIPNGIGIIDTEAFSDSHSLKEIILPDSIFFIQFMAFPYSFQFTDIYYSGTEEQWEEIEIGNFNDNLTTATIHFNSSDGQEQSITPAVPEQAQPNYLPIKGTFGSSSEQFVGQGEFDYNDNDFSQSAYTYNHHLSKMSLRLAMSAFAVKDTGYETQYYNAKTLLEGLNFKEVSWNENYTEKPSINSIGVIAGNKKVTFGNEDYTLIAVTIRGGGYEAEWGGNFNVGDGEHHEGFRIARDHVLTFLTDYISEKNIQGNVKIWITGYSRAAATANLTAAYLDTHQYIFGAKTSVLPKDIYAYCFETPAGVKNPPEDQTYHNIFSIVNRNDFVPMVAMEKWGYGRYGLTYYLPSPETNTNYNELEGKMHNYYNKYVTNEYQTHRARTIGQYSDFKLSWSAEEVYPYFGFYLKEVGTENNENMGVFLQKLIDTLADTFENPSKYTKDQQEAMIYIGEKLIGEKKFEEFLTVLTSQLTSRLSVGSLSNEVLSSALDKLGLEENHNILYDATKAAFKDVGVTINENTLSKVVTLLLSLVPDHNLETLIGNIDIIPVGHFPELCLAWLDATDETMYTDKNKNFIKPQEKSISVLVNNQALSFDQPPVIENDRTLVPLRAIFEALGAEVLWDGETSTVTATRGDITIS